MAFTCNASLSGNCNKEMNRQLQGLQSRVKTLEKHSATHTQLTIIGLIKSIAAFIASGQAAAAAILSADPQVALAIAGRQAWEQLMDMIPGLDFQAMLAEIAMANVSLPPFEDLLMSMIADSVGAKLAAAQQELADAIANGLPADQIADLQAKVACFGIQINLAAAFKTTQNRLSSCQAAQLIVGG